MRIDDGPYGGAAGTSGDDAAEVGKRLITRRKTVDAGHYRQQIIMAY